MWYSDERCCRKIFSFPMKSEQRQFGISAQSLPRSVAENMNIREMFHFQNTQKSRPKLTKQNKIHHIIDSIMENCPTVIPSAECGNYNVEELVEHKAVHTVKSYKQKRDHLSRAKKPNRKGKNNFHIKELLSICEELAEIPVHSTYNNSTSLCPHNIILGEFYIQKPLACFEHVQIPITNVTEIIASSSSNQRKDKDSGHLKTCNHDTGLTDISIDRVPDCRRRIPSLCDSEDSFIIFESEMETPHQDEDSDGDPFSNCDKTIEESNTMNESSSLTSKKTKVHFAIGKELCQVHNMITWSYAYQAARRGPWEIYARDRTRFQDRIFRVERDIKHIFNPLHRDRIYKERFEKNN